MPFLTILLYHRSCFMMSKVPNSNTKRGHLANPDGLFPLDFFHSPFFMFMDLLFHMLYNQIRERDTVTVIYTAGNPFRLCPELQRRHTMVKILSDSTCDLSKELTERYNIGIIPLYVRLGNNEYLDGINITPAQIYKWSDEHGETPKTAAPDIETISKMLDPDGNDEYVIFTISSSMSASYNNARLAAESLDMTDRVHVIDSANLSTGIGLQVIRAAELAAEGKSAGEIVSEINAIKDKVRASFIIDTLVYLHRGGRCSGLAALFGSVLKLHPRIAVSDGAMHPEKKYRGTGRKYVLEYVKDMEPELKKARKDRVFITHSPCDKEIVDAVREYLVSLNRFDEILETDAGSVIASHCGPGTLGVLFISE